jgi:hypothetical protein
VSVYVDRLAPCVPSTKWRWLQSAHLVADDLDELHAFASSIGLGRAWFQPKSHPHYDLDPRRHEAALNAGAKLIDKRELVALIRRHRDARKLETTP